MGEPLARALALVRHCELPRLLTITDDPEARREAFVWACIKEMASAHPVADELPASCRQSRRWGLWSWGRMRTASS
jgi:hypothetical protein